jgi:tRNA 2-thiouridine synthesizing protein A
LAGLDPAIHVSFPYVDEDVDPRVKPAGSEGELESVMPDAAPADAVLDATGLLCPLPVLKARRALRDVPAGGILEVLATDPGAVADFEHFCRTTGCELLEASETDGVLRFRLKKPG